MSERPMPHSIEAEKATLGSIIIDPYAIKHIPWLRPSDFYRDTHRAIFEAILALHQANIPPNEIMVTDYLQQQGKLEEIGGQGALLAFVSYVPNSAAIEHYALTVLNRAIARKIVEIVETAAGRAYEDHSPDEALDEAMQALADLKLRLRNAEEEEEPPRLYTLTEALQRPKGVPIWEGMLKKGNRVELFGESYSGKTFLGLHMGNCFTRQEALFGRKTLSSGPVLYIAAEDFEGVTLRNYGWLQYRHLPPDTLNKCLMLYGEPVMLRDPASIANLIQLVKQARFMPEMLVIDNFSLCYDGSDIDGLQHREAFKGIAALQRAFRDQAGIPATAIIINHKNKQGAYYGHSSHKNFVDVMIEVDQNHATGIITVTFIKVRNAALPAPLILRFEPVTLDPLTGESTVVLLPLQKEEAGILAQTKEREALEVLASIGELVRATDWEEAWCKKTNQSDTQYKTMRKHLLTLGLIDKEEGARGRYFLTEKGKQALDPKGNLGNEGELPQVPQSEQGRGKGNSLKESYPFPFPSSPSDSGEIHCALCDNEVYSYTSEGIPLCLAHAG